MKKPLSIINKEQGFILPYVLFIVTITLLVITTNIQLYENELKITDRQVEQVKAETLFQMARVSLIKELESERIIPSERISYQFPDGTVEITINPLTDMEYQLLFTVVTNITQYTFEFPDTFILDHEES